MFQVLKVSPRIFSACRLAGQAFGVQSADGLLLGWTAIGVALFMLLLPCRGNLPAPDIGLAGGGFFSGMDIVTLLGEGRLLFKKAFWSGGRGLITTPRIPPCCYGRPIMPCLPGWGVR
jgi:hypothetical protein